MSEMNPTGLATELCVLRGELNLGLSPGAVRLTADMPGPTLWLSVCVVMGPGDTERSVRDSVLEAIGKYITWYDEDRSVVVTSFSKGRGRKRRDGSATRRTGEVTVSLREPPPPVPKCEFCGQPGGH